MNQTREPRRAPIETTRDISEFKVGELAVRELAIAKGFSNEDHRRFSEWAETIGPSRGSKLAAKAWTDRGPHALMPTGSSRTTIFGLAVSTAPSRPR
jgi:hypothetical protein